MATSTSTCLHLYTCIRFCLHACLRVNHSTYLHIGPYLHSYPPATSSLPTGDRLPLPPHIFAFSFRGLCSTSHANPIPPTAGCHRSGTVSSRHVLYFHKHDGLHPASHSWGDQSNKSYGRRPRSDYLSPGKTSLFFSALWGMLLLSATTSPSILFYPCFNITKVETHSTACTL